jgi:hypothetical protein
MRTLRTMSKFQLQQSIAFTEGRIARIKLCLDDPAVAGEPRILLVSYLRSLKKKSARLGNQIRVIAKYGDAAGVAAAAVPYAPDPASPEASVSADRAGGSRNLPPPTPAARAPAEAVVSDSRTAIPDGAAAPPGMAVLAASTPPSDDEAAPANCA